MEQTRPSHHASHVRSTGLPFWPSACPPYDPAVSKADTLTTALAMSCTQPEGDINRRLERNELYGFGFPELDRLVSILRGEAF
ncbi:MAG: hypothetical protein ACRD8Z_23830 [Nitrososphaeraceae archaeon]